MVDITHCVVYMCSIPCISRLLGFPNEQVYKVETAGDCYIVAGALMQRDEDGFQTVGHDLDARKGAEKVMAFAKVKGRA